MDKSESVQTFTTSTRSVGTELIKLDKNDNVGLKEIIYHQRSSRH